MFHLWIVMTSGLILWLYFKHGHMLSELFSANTQQNIAKTLPMLAPDMLAPLVNITSDALNNFRDHAVNIFLIVTIVLAIIQIVLYMPSSLRYVYHTHISPVKYTLKHVVVSVFFLAPILFSINFIFKFDDSLDPRLEKLLAEEQPDVNDAENVFFPLLTLWLPDIQDRVAYGKQWVSEHKRMLAYFKTSNKPSNPLEYPGYRKLLLRGMNKEDQSSINQLYIKELAGDGKKLATDINNYLLKYNNQLRSSRSLYRYQRYLNPVNYTSQSFTRFYSDYSGSMLSLHRLNLIYSLAGHDIDVKAIIKNISDDYLFNLVMIRNSSDPDVKYLHLQKQTINVQFLYNLLQRPEFQTKDVYNFINYLPVLAEEFLGQNLIARKDMLLVQGQLDAGRQYLSNQQSPAANIIDYTLKYNKTLNCIYAHASADYNLDNKKISLYLKAQKPAPSKASLDNLIGDLICNASIKTGTKDVNIKSVEVNGSVMILKARSKLFEENINDINATAYLTNHSGKYKNPFTEGALQWDRDSKQIYFDYTVGKENIRVIY